jgi:hypothetical protein
MPDKLWVDNSSSNSVLFYLFLVNDLKGWYAKL